MTDHLISYLKCVSLPSENIKLQRKKNFESLLKICKKNKRDFTNKLNKNQIDKSQVISYYENKRNQLIKIKKDRLEKIILLTQEFINDRSDDEIENSSSDNTSDSKKRHIDDYDNGQSKKQKLISVEEEITKANVEQDKLAEIDKDIDVSLNKLPININKDVEEFTQPSDGIIIGNVAASLSSENSSDKQVNKTFNIENIESEKNQVSVKVSEKIIAQPIIRNISSSIKPQIPKISTKPTVKTGPTPVRVAVKTNKNSELKTPQQQQPIYKGKYQNNPLSISSKTSSLSKSQTLSSCQKKPVVEIRKEQDKHEKKRKLEENEARRKENLMKLHEINNYKKTQALAKSANANNNNSSSMKQVASTTRPNVPFVPSSASASAARKQINFAPLSTTTNKKQQPTATVMPVGNKTVTSESHPRTNPIVPLKVPQPPLISSFSALKPINNNNSSNKPPPQPPVESILEESSPAVVLVAANFDNNFKTPFVKKRTTILSDSCKKLIDNHESYFLDDLIDLDSDEEDDEENRPSHKVPRWCQKDNGTLINLIKYQSKHFSPSKIFLEACLVSIDYKQIFGNTVEIKPGCLEPWK